MVADNKSLIGPGYGEWLRDLKKRVRHVQLKAAVAVNQELLRFYWELGGQIVERQKSAAWGDGFLKQLSADMLAEFPDFKGFPIGILGIYGSGTPFMLPMRQLGNRLFPNWTRQIWERSQ